MSNNTEQQKGKSNNGCAILLIAILVIISWGLPELIRGNGFETGVIDNIKAFFALATIAIIGFVIFKISTKN